MSRKVTMQLELSESWNPTMQSVFHPRRLRTLRYLWVAGILLSVASIFLTVSDSDYSGYVWIGAFLMLCIEQWVEASGWRMAYEGAASMVVTMMQGKMTELDASREISQQESAA